jgi:hypothetical protein
VPPCAPQFLAQFPEVLDNAIVDQRDVPGRVRLGVALALSAVRRPADAGDTDRARSGPSGQLCHQIGKRNLRAAQHEISLVDRAQFGPVVTAYSIRRSPLISRPETDSLPTMPNIVWSAFNLKTTIRRGACGYCGLG